MDFIDFADTRPMLEYTILSLIAGAMTDREAERFRWT
jgi:hypothetical protein